MLTLVFLRFIGEKYEDSLLQLRKELIELDLDPNDEEIVKAFFDDMDGTYALPEEARWSTIKNETGSWRGALFVAGYTTIVA